VEAVNFIDTCAAVETVRVEAIVRVDFTRRALVPGLALAGEAVGAIDAGSVSTRIRIAIVLVDFTAHADVALLALAPEAIEPLLARAVLARIHCGTRRRLAVARAARVAGRTCAREVVDAIRANPAVGAGIGRTIIDVDLAAGTLVTSSTGAHE
jgi:hypothetical protein